MSRNYALFETERFYADLDRIRRERHLYWSQVAACVGFRVDVVHQPSLLSFNPHIDTLVPLAVWAGLSLDAYIQVNQASDPERELPTRPARRGRRSSADYAARYDVVRFYADLDRARKARGLSWLGVWRCTPIGVPHNLSYHFAQRIALSPKACDALATWANLDFSRYLKESGKHE